MSMLSGHLGDRVSALADGQLSPAATERALSHVVGCPRCAAELADARRARRLLSQVRDVRPDSDLTARILAMGCASAGFTARARQEHRPAPAVTVQRDQLPSQLHALRSRGVLTGEVVPAHRGLRALIGSVTGIGVVAVALFLLGGHPVAVVTPAAQPQQALSLLGQTEEAAGTVPVAADGQEPSTSDYLTWMQQEGWICPTVLPDGWSITSVQLQEDDTVLQVAISGSLGALVITEQHGQLDTSALAGADQIELDQHVVYLLSRSPWHLAWQDGDTVMEVTSAEDEQEVTAMVEAFPGKAYDDGVSARLNRGWDTLASAVSLS